MAIVHACHLAGGLACATDAVLGQLAPRRRIDWIASFFRRSGGRSNLELVIQAHFFDVVFHHKLGHGTAADVAEADEENFMERFAHGQNWK